MHEAGGTTLPSATHTRTSRRRKTPVLSDLRIALRTIRRTPGFAVAAVLTLATGIAGLTVVFALVNALLLRPLPIHRPADVVSIELRREDGSSATNFSFQQYELLREHARGLSRLAAYSVSDYAVSIAGADVEVAMAYEVSASYFDALGIPPALGRFFRRGVDDVRGGSPVVVISHDLWQTRFGGDAEVIGRRLLVNGHALSIIGVAPRGFAGTISVLDGRFWVPLTMVPVLRQEDTMYRPGGMYWLTLVGRLAPGTSRPQAQALLSGSVRSIMAAQPDEFEPRTGARSTRAAPDGVRLAPLRGLPHMAVGPVAGFLAVLFVAALLVVVIAAVNITSIMLARITARSRELAVRRSLGATRGRIVTLLLAENALLFFAGAAAALVLATWLLAALPALLSLSPVPVVLDASPDGRVLGFAALVALALSAVFGLPPALYGADTGGNALVADMRGARRGMRLRSALVVAQVALSVVLLVSASLLTRALQRALSVDPGFDAASVVTAQLELGTAGYDAQRSRIFFTQLVERLESRVEVEHAGLSSMQPLLGFSVMQLRPEGQVEAPAGGIDYNAVDPGFLRALRVPVVAGRPFDERDLAAAPATAIVNEALAQRYWPGEDPIGKRLYRGPAERETSLEVVGVTQTGRYRELGESPQPFVYLPLGEGSSASAYIYVRGAPRTTDLVAALRAEVRALDPAVPLRDTATLQRNLDMLTMPQRLGAAALGAFGVIGLLLAAIGIYGLVAFTVAQRTREIGIRMAVGARERDVVRLFLGRSARLLVIGTLAGLPLAFAAAQALAALLYGLSPADPLTFTGVPLLLTAVALLAAWLPARRASRADPLVVLRAE
jgi:predicted permease